MRKKLFIFHIFYYILTPLVYLGSTYLLSLLLRLSGFSGNLGAVMAITYGLLFVMLPIFTAVCMRFSLLKWYVDPFAAAEPPLLLYFFMAFNQAKRVGTWQGAFLSLNQTLCNDRAEGWLFLGGLFLFGLLTSLSFGRKREESISYRLLAKISAFATKS